MGIYKKGNTYYIDYYFCGRRKRECIGPDRHLAEEVLKKRKNEIAEWRHLDIKKNDKVKFEEFAKEFIVLHSRPNKKSWKSDFYNLKLITIFFKGRYLYDITGKDIEKYKAERSKFVSPATTNRDLATLKTLFNKAVEWGKLEESPARDVKFLREPSRKIRYLEREEVTRLLSNCPRHLRAIVSLALFTGIKKSEILNIKWSEVDFLKGIIYLTDAETGAKREIFMNDLVKKALVAIPKNPHGPYVFCNEQGNPCRDIRKSFFTALRKSGILNFRFHDLRHTFASHLIMSGVDINTVKELLGHKDIRMTLKYAHLSPDRRKKAVEILGRQIGGIWTAEAIFDSHKKWSLLQPIEN